MSSASGKKLKAALAFLWKSFGKGYTFTRPGRIAPGELTAVDIDERLRKCYQWLERAFEATGKQGFSKGYNLFSGWMPAYPETTGYIITSLIKYSQAFHESDALSTAILAGDWLLSRLNTDGGIPAIGDPHGPSLVFDTGMVLDGFSSLHESTGEERFLRGARKCSVYLCETQNPDGSWSNCYQGIPHAYHARVAWPLLAFGLRTGFPDAVITARRNLDWVVSQQLSDGYWKNAHFTRRMPYANTHGIGYILEGLLESHRLSPDEKWYQSALAAGTKLAGMALRNNGYLPAYIKPDWGEARIVPFPFACLTGTAQISRALLTMEEFSGGGNFGQAAIVGTRYVTAFQDVFTSWRSVCGALPGSTPIYGGYLPFQYPNWAVKFLIDLFLALRSRNTVP